MHRSNRAVHAAKHGQARPMYVSRDRQRRLVRNQELRMKGQAQHGDAFTAAVSAVPHADVLTKQVDAAIKRYIREKEQRDG